MPHKDELLFVAINEAKAMFDRGYRAAAQAPCSRWRAAAASPPSRAQLVNMRDGGFISAHDFHIGSLIAEVVCGGDVDAGSAGRRGVPDDAGAQGLLRACSSNPKTQERIMGMMQTGKPVRN